MRSPFLRCAAAALTAAALAGCAQQRPGYVGPAPSITSPWKIVQMVGPADGESMMADISATRAAGCLGDRAGLREQLRIQVADACSRALGRQQLAAASCHAPACAAC